MKEDHMEESLKEIKALTEETDKQIGAIMRAERQDTEIRLLLKSTARLLDRYNHERESEKYRLLTSEKPN